MGTALQLFVDRSRHRRAGCQPRGGRGVGANPISFVVPCHRALGKSGALTGYHWGLTRKRAILGWEAGQTLGLTGRASRRSPLRALESGVDKG